MELSGSSIMFGPVTIAGLAPASVKRRVAARIIDYVVHYAVALVAGFALGIALVLLAILSGQPPDSLTDKVTGKGIAATVLSVLGYVVYHAACEGLYGATLGKRLLGIHVVDENGAHCTFKAALVRSVAFFVDGMFFGMVGFLAIRGSSFNQRIGDRAAHTVVERSSMSKIPPPSDWQFAAVLLAALFADGAFMVIGLLLPLLF